MIFLSDKMQNKKVEALGAPCTELESGSLVFITESLLRSDNVIIQLRVIVALSIFQRVVYCASVSEN